MLLCLLLHFVDVAVVLAVTIFIVIVGAVSAVSGGVAVVNGGVAVANGVKIGFALVCGGITCCTRY